MLEPHPLFREPVDIGRLVDLAPIAAYGMGIVGPSCLLATSDGNQKPNQRADAIPAPSGTRKRFPAHLSFDLVRAPTCSMIFAAVAISGRCSRTSICPDICGLRVEASIAKDRYVGW